MSTYQIKVEALKPFRRLPDPHGKSSNIKNVVTSYHILPSAIIYLLLFLISFYYLQFFTNEIAFSLPRYQFLLFGFFCKIIMYLVMEIGNRFLIFFAALIFCGGEYDRNEWHLFFKNPWMSTSLKDFWSIRWHQLFREIFVLFAYNPLERLINNKIKPLLGKDYQKIGIMLEKIIPTIGVFFISGIMHEYIVYTSMYQFWKPGEQLLFFILQPVGMFFEKLIFSFLTLPKWLGWLWTLMYLSFTLPLFISPYIKQQPW
ncbi:membrane bound O-acyl transferase family-domain-containing protein [Gigaspora rosea]|uniref:Membrane bound O-acyl transferase family-domain-containing protein n=1 Tax=Gigaspora rosea TaxID=44941 RepID=A0A397W7C3_9GLOM|nr:membrane bound O-acyl transferase family-domain-containing protein [Gigaspora rosea]